MKRPRHLQKLKQETFDLLIIGGGATGAGAALDAATRGLKVALVDRGDFVSGTSSRSTKLIHGGVRYLELAVKQFDRGQLNLVKEALHERATLLKIAPHLTRVLPIVTPLYKRFQISYYRIGLKVYDWLAGKRNLFKSRTIKADAIASQFPQLKDEGLKGGVLYADGQFDDARMALSILLTAEEQGATLLNYAQVVSLAHQSGKLSSVQIQDTLTQEVFEVKAKSFINATGPFVDAVRKLDDPQSQPLVTVSSGIHIMMDASLCPSNMGLLFPKTEDGRVLFMLPWLGYTLIGTTDNPASLENHPKPSDEDIDYLLNHICHYLKVPLSRDNILASWSGLRPLVSQSQNSNTAHLSRDHLIQVSESGLITITGGKWTTYRKMALDVVDEAIKVSKIQPQRESQTENLILIGGREYRAQQVQVLQERFALSKSTAAYLSRAYGDRAFQILEIAQQQAYEPLIEGQKYLAAEVIYAMKEEFAEHAIDFLARRTRLTFLDHTLVKKALPKVLELMAQEKGWSEAKIEEERRLVLEYLS